MLIQIILSFLMEVAVVTFLGIRFLLEGIYVLRTLPNALFALDTLHSGILLKQWVEYAHIV